MKKKGILSFVTKWIILEDIILSGINQTQEDKCYVISIYVESKKVELIETNSRMVVAKH